MSETENVEQGADKRVADLEAQLAEAKAETMVRVMGLEEQLRLEIRLRDEARAEIVGLKRTISMDYDWAVWMLDQEDKLIARVKGLHERCLRLDGGAGFDGACVECVGADEVPEHLRDFRCWKHTPLPTVSVLP